MAHRSANRGVAVAIPDPSHTSGGARHRREGV